MGDKSDITCFPPVTLIIDRDGHRIRRYERQDPTRPGQQDRRRMAAVGQRWCRGCASWLPAADVRGGVCRLHAAAEYRTQYARNPRDIRRRAYARKRHTQPLPMIAIDYLTEQFNGLCAYCDEPATTWDHVVPIVKGGQTIPGNVVPACVRCNSSKKDRDLSEWLQTTGRQMHIAMADVLALGGEA